MTDKILKQPDLNLVMLSGNLTRDAELKYVSNGDAVCKFRMAYNRRFKNKAGDWKQKPTVYLDVTVWGKTAEWCGEYLKKGTSVIVQARLEADEWEDKETGDIRSVIVLAGERVQLIEKEETRGHAGVGNPKHENEPIPEDDIPF